jgi:hypothetical protein
MQYTVPVGIQTDDQGNRKYPQTQKGLPVHIDQHSGKELQQKGRVEKTCRKRGVPEEVGRQEEQAQRDSGKDTVQIPYGYEQCDGKKKIEIEFITQGPGDRKYQLEHIGIGKQERTEKIITVKFLRVFDEQDEYCCQKERPVTEIDPEKSVLHECFCTFETTLFVKCGVGHNEPADHKKDIYP